MMEDSDIVEASGSNEASDAKRVNCFAIDKDSIPCVAMEQQADELKDLDICAYNQVEFEAEIMDQVDQALKKDEEERQKLRIEKEMKSVADEIILVKKRINQLDKALQVAPYDDLLILNVGKRERLKNERLTKVEDLKKLEERQQKLLAIKDGKCDIFGNQQLAIQDSNSEQFSLHHGYVVKESEQERLIRMGQMTPFGTMALNQAPKESSCDRGKNLDHTKTAESAKPLEPGPAVKKRIKKMKLGSKYASGMALKKKKQTIVANFCSDPELSDFENGNDFIANDNLSDEEYVPEQFPSDDSDAEFLVDDDDDNKPKKTKVAKKELSSGSLEKSKKSPRKLPEKIVDDGLLDAYTKRIKLFHKMKLVEKHKKIMASENGVVDSDDEDCVEFDANFKIPSTLWNRLYSYQQTGVRWMWELHQQNCGGIVGDEMGLGKTIQVIVFFASLKMSNLLTDGDLHRGLGPVLLVCPTTVMHQWVREFHLWWPPFRVAILHDSGSYNGKKENLILNINEKNGVLITSYAGFVQHQKTILKYEWHYIVLDEGHKIRNPDAQATLVAKQVRTPHRLILSGSPVQNNLKELWSLFDFIFPGKLGTLPVFMQQFSVPIVQGGYANASQVQVQTAYKCATVLRDTIKPYLLRRMKSDVKMVLNLPNKNEQVLFCKLSDEQTQLYKAYVASPEVESIMNARLKVFVGLINLRKICNHPDLYTGGTKVFKDTDVSTFTEDMNYGYYKKSGKMIVVDALLKMWHRQGHRVLLFTQSRQMMEILEIFIKRREYTYMRMDGATSVSSRQPAIAKFNSDSSIFVFLLTTRVGGLGVNLTGANRIIIYDPDWNPSTDAQARERSWRIGQERQVTIYRLLTAGTIEEKIYHRQIFKQFVTNRVLKDPRQRRFFKSNDLYELFTFSDMGNQGTETSAIFAGTGSEVKPVHRPKVKSKSTVCLEAVKSVDDIKITFSSEKIAKMKEFARKLSLKLLQKNPPCSIPVSQKAEEKDACGKDTISEPEKAKDTEGLNISSDGVLKRKHNVERHRKKKQRKTVVEGETIEYLVKSDTYKPIEQESEKDDYVLSKLFKKSGVHTALKHDAIVDAADPDYMLVEGEANRVAKEAVKALRQSRRQCARAAEGIPTWTGFNGGKARFGLKKQTSVINDASEAGPSGLQKKSEVEIHFNGKSTVASQSSADLLNAIRQRKQLDDRENSDSDSDDPDSTMAISSPQYDDLLTEIRNFVAFRASVDGQATTEEVLNEFKNKLPTQQTAIFKSLLTQVCDFHRKSGGDGVWYLKEEFR